MSFDTLITTFGPIVVIAAFAWMLYSFGKHQKDAYTIVSATYEKDILTITYKDGSIGKYKGSGTVWYHYPIMKRCNTHSESQLSDIYEYIKEHGNPYPTAHENKHPAILSTQKS